MHATSSRPSISCKNIVKRRKKEVSDTICPSIPDLYEIKDENVEKYSKNRSTAFQATLGQSKYSVQFV